MDHRDRRRQIGLKNYVVLLAGGVGKRMGGDIPKQFIKVNDRPIIAYTLENFQKSPAIEKIVIVCIKDWIDHLRKLLEKYKKNFNKIE